MTKVFLGGTWNESTWRDKLIAMLNIEHFNPVVDDWTPECMAEELEQREECDYCLYVITPQMTGVYSIAEVVDDSNKRPDKTVLCVLQSYDGVYWADSQARSLSNVVEMIEANGATSLDSLEDVADFLNTMGAFTKANIS